MARIQQASDVRITGSGGKRRVVVAVDGSTESIAALRLAVAAARKIGAAVDVVCASGAADPQDDSASAMHRYRDTYGPGQVMPPHGLVRRERLAGGSAEFFLRRAFPNGPPDVPLRLMVRLGARDDLVIEAASDGDPLLVIVGQVGAARASQRPADQEANPGESSGRTTNTPGDQP